MRKGPTWTPKSSSPGAETRGVRDRRFVGVAFSVAEAGVLPTAISGARAMDTLLLTAVPLRAALLGL